MEQFDTPDFNGNRSQTLTSSITSGFYTTGDNGPGITFYATIQNVVYVVESACIHRMTIPSVFRLQVVVTA